mmetsp:Transcript_25087/g.58742  ORF Transcript_25087/g.58742 Transcript_25087/m.58742 type:complete len:223 (-) Transcript_25087:1562-2230(-)
MRRGRGDQGILHQAQGHPFGPLLPGHQAARGQGVRRFHRPSSRSAGRRFFRQGAARSHHQHHLQRLPHQGQGGQPARDRIRAVHLQGPPDRHPPGDAREGPHGSAPPLHRARPGPRPRRSHQARRSRSGRRCLPRSGHNCLRTVHHLRPLQDGRSGQQRPDPRQGCQPSQLLPPGHPDHPLHRQARRRPFHPWPQRRPLHPRSRDHQEGAGPPAPLGCGEES